jgi:excisionase family DNA binding protein
VQQLEVTMSNKTPGGPEDRLAVTVTEFAAAIGLSPNHVYKKIHAGIIPAVQLGEGCSYRIPKTFLNRIAGGDGDGR